MENSLKSIVDGLTADQVELEKFISESKRPNVKRGLEEQLRIIKQRTAEEQKKLEISESKSESSSNSNKNSSNVTYESINKYSFDSGDKFVK